MKNVTFFGGAINDTTTIEYKDSIKIGKLLGDYGFNIKNGGYRGLMEAVSLGASSSENNVGITGFTCRTFGSIKGNSYLTKTIPCEDIYERLKLMISDSEIFIVQRGGIGTLSEIFLLLDGVRKLKNNVPDIYLIGKSYKDLFDNLSGFMGENVLNKLIFCENYEDFSIKFKEKHVETE